MTAITSTGYIYRTHENYGEAYFYTEATRKDMELSVRKSFPELEEFKDGDQFHTIEKNGQVVGCYSVVSERGSYNSLTGRQHVAVYKLSLSDSGLDFIQKATDWIEVDTDDPEKIAIEWIMELKQ